MIDFRVLAGFGLALSVAAIARAQDGPYNGLSPDLSNLYRVSSAKTFSISPENLTGEKGKGGMAVQGSASRAASELGQGWKVNPFVVVEPGTTFNLAQIGGSGAIQHIWLTPTGNWRFSILRMFWDGESEPSVQVPVGDFFAMGWNKYSPISSLAVCVNPGSAFNSYWPMPFRKGAKITLENIDTKPMTIYYQIDYTQTQVPADAAYFHALFRRTRFRLSRFTR